MTPQLSIVLPTFSNDPGQEWTRLIDLAITADQVGIDRIVSSEHVVFGERLDAYADPRLGGQRNGQQPTGPDGPWLDPLVTLSYLAAVTKRVRLGTAILLAALRRPVVLAKSVATLDVLSGGRFDLGVGVGWQREEYQAAGLAFERRGQLLDQTLEVCQTLWRSHSASYAGSGLSFANIHQAPKPQQVGGVPIWVSGTVNKRSMDRLARFGTGWIPWGDDALDIVNGTAAMRQEMKARGRGPSEIQVMCRLPLAMDGNQIDFPGTFASVPQLRNHGVTDFRIVPQKANSRISDQEFLSQAVCSFRAAVGKDD